jgi:hypothetical protein
MRPQQLVGAEMVETSVPAMFATCFVCVYCLIIVSMQENNMYDMCISTNS